MNSLLAARLEDFAGDLRPGKGALCVVLVVTDHARTVGLPLDPSSLLADSEGQVKGLGKAAVQKILARHGIHKILAKEGGRTSRKSVGNMRRYVMFLNELHGEGVAGLDAIERFWIERVKQFLAKKPFRLKLDANASLRSVVHDLLQQAFDRQADSGGQTDAGALLQHLVGAKLDCAIQPESIEHNSYSTADAPKARRGDFELGDTVVHVTTTPTEAVIGQCRRNLDDGLQPILITQPAKIAVAVGLAEQAAIAHRLDILDIEQFLALNLHEWGRFRTSNRRATIGKLVSRYNEIVETHETDPGLKIAFR